MFYEATAAAYLFHDITRYLSQPCLVDVFHCAGRGDRAPPVHRPSAEGARLSRAASPSGPRGGRFHGWSRRYMEVLLARL